MGGEVKQLLMNIFTQACMPTTISAILKFFFLNDKFIWSLKSSEESITYLTLQWYL